MKRILLDTNIVLDVLLRRSPHLVDSALLWGAIEERRLEGFVSAHAVTTVHYVLRRTSDAGSALHALEILLRLFRVAAVDEQVIRTAILSGAADFAADFEDAVTCAAAAAAGCDLIATRDPKGFRNSPVPAVPPAEALRLISA